MGVLRDFERRLGGLVEGAFAKVFKGGVEPVEIASALARETDDRRSISPNRVLVPNEFAVELATSDYTRLEPYDAPLCEELAAMVSEHAKEQRYTFAGPVRVRLSKAEDLDVGVFRIRSSVAAADPVAVGRRRSAQPRRSLPGVPRLVITSKSGEAPAGVDRDYPLEAETTVIGRSVDCDIRLNDTGVSRQHGEVRRTEDGQFLYIDFKSTNGSIVNGRPATQVKLINGDQIELGGIILTFRREDGRGGAAGAAGAAGDRAPRRLPPAAPPPAEPVRPARSSPPYAGAPSRGGEASRRQPYDGDVPAGERDRGRDSGSRVGGGYPDDAYRDGPRSVDPRSGGARSGGPRRGEPPGGGGQQGRPDPYRERPDDYREPAVPRTAPRRPEADRRGGGEWAADDVRGGADPYGRSGGRGFGGSVPDGRRGYPEEPRRGAGRGMRPDAVRPDAVGAEDPYEAQTVRPGRAEDDWQGGPDERARRGPDRSR